MAVLQMRDYLIRPDRLDDYMGAWLKRIHPLRLEHGFMIDGAWLDRPNGRFFWTLGYDGEDWVQANEKYDEVRRRFDPDPATWLIKESKVEVELVLAQGRVKE